MKPNASATFYWQTGAKTWTRIPVEGVFWQGSYEHGTDGKSGGERCEWLCFPLSCADLPEYRSTGKERCYVVRGLCAAELTDDDAHAAFVKEMRPFTVKSVERCDYGTITHYEVVAL